MSLARPIYSLNYKQESLSTTSIIIPYFFKLRCWSESSQNKWRDSEVYKDRVW